MVRQLIEGLRLPEIIVKTGFILIGAVFAIDQIETTDLKIFVELFIVSLVSGLAVYTINAYFGYPDDHFNDRLTNLQSFSRIAFKWMAILFSGLSLIWMFFKGFYPFVFTFLIFFLWTIYVWPKTSLKTKTGGGLVIAFLAQLCHFGVGYVYLAKPNLSMLLIGIYFALLFAGGHAWHELNDFDADEESGARTTAIALGRYNAMWLAQAFFLSAAIYWFVLGLMDFVEVRAVAPFMFAYILQKLCFYCFKLDRQISSAQIESYRKLYLLIFFLATIYIIWPKLAFLQA
jgi:4-hydroxybenzoate polyprenyltransferase